MPLEQPSPLDIVRMLIHGTKNGSIKWEAESTEGDSFRTIFPTGGVRISRVVAFSGVGGPLLLELLDPKDRTLFQFRPETMHDLPPVKELFELASRQALNLDQAIGALVEEIRKRSEKQ